MLAQIDQSEFGTLTEAHRREIYVHCYRMLGSIHDAEDMVQETFLRAWRRRETFEGRASVRAWLYKIATNLCLDTLDQRPRRVLPVTRQAASAPSEFIATPIMEPIWLEPIPDDLLATEEASPDVRFSARESVTLAFIAALHCLPPRQRAILILRDVLDWQANEVADLLGITVAAVKSALHRARATLADHYSAGHEVAGASMLDTQKQGQLDRFVRAWETADIDLLVAILKEDAVFSMPPMPSWVQGREDIRSFVTGRIFNGAGLWYLLPTHANRQPAFALYHRDQPEGDYHAYGIHVLSLEGQAIAEITTFKTPDLFPYFNLPMATNTSD